MKDKTSVSHAAAPDMFDPIQLDQVARRLRRSVLHEYCRQGLAEKVCHLLEKNPDVNIPDIDGITPLHLAAGNGFNDICEMLLRHGARDDLKSRANLTPSECAHKYQQPQTARVIIEATSLRNSHRIKAIHNTRRRQNRAPRP